MYVFLIVFCLIFLAFLLSLFKSRKQSNFFKRYFKGHLNKTLIKEVIKNGELDLDGEEKVITIMFLDIRGFTALAERLPNKKVLSLLNDHLASVSKIIINHNGNLDKYLGDGLMAFWGAPIHDDQQASNALSAAKEIIEYFDNYSLDVGIGINTGQAIIGEIGMKGIRSYTAIGDSVNLAARVESINKKYGTFILFTDDTKRKLDKETKNKIIDKKYREIDEVRVYGKVDSNKIYEYIHKPIGNNQRLGYEKFNRALDIYRKGDWQTAEHMFRSVYKILNGDKVSKVFIERCKELNNKGVLFRWDGIANLEK